MGRGSGAPRGLGPRAKGQGKSMSVPVFCLLLFLANHSACHTLSHSTPRVYLVAITDELGGHTGMQSIVAMVQANPAPSSHLRPARWRLLACLLEHCPVASGLGPWLLGICSL